MLIQCHGIISNTIFSTYLRYIIGASLSLSYLLSSFYLPLIPSSLLPSLYLSIMLYMCLVLSSLSPLCCCHKVASTQQLLSQLVAKQTDTITAVLEHPMYFHKDLLLNSARTATSQQQRRRHEYLKSIEKLSRLKEEVQSGKVKPEEMGSKYAQLEGTFQATSRAEDEFKVVSGRLIMDLDTATTNLMKELKGIALTYALTQVSFHAQCTGIWTTLRDELETGCIAPNTYLHLEQRQAEDNGEGKATNNNLSFGREKMFSRPEFEFEESKIGMESVSFVNDEK
jgi:hypothetical protein